MNEEIAELLNVAARLEAAGLAYMVTGSVALSIFAVPRMTRDIDIVIKVFPADAGKLLAAFSADYYLDEDTLRYAILHHGMFNIINQRTFIKIDFIVRKDEEYRIEEFLRRRQVAVDGKFVWIVSPEDLLLSKLVWAKESESEMQLRDAKQLLSEVPDIDNDYLQSWANRLGVSRLLEKAKRDA